MWHEEKLPCRQEILGKIKEQGLTVKEAVEQYGVSDNTIYGWLSKSAKGAPTWSEVNRLKRDNQQLLQLVGELTIKLSSTQNGCLPRQFVLPAGIAGQRLAAKNAD